MRNWPLTLLLLSLPVVSACDRHTPADAPAPAPAPPVAAPVAPSPHPPVAPPPVDPLRAWELPAAPAFTPAARVWLIHNAHTAWNRKTCAGDPVENLKTALATEKARPAPPPPARLWVGPDSLAPRELAQDLQAPPVSPLEWVRALRGMGVTWMTLGRDDRRLGREAVEKLARATGMRFVTDVWEGPAFVPCVTEPLGPWKVAVCALSSDTPELAAAWTRVLAAAGAADLRVLFASGDPAWQKGLAALPEPPDLIVTGGIASTPHGRLLAPGLVSVAAGPDLRHVGELDLAPGNTPGARPLLITERDNLAEEQERLRLGFDNVARVLARPGLSSSQRGVYERRLGLVRQDWERLATRAEAFAAAAPAGPRVSFSLRPLGACATR